MFNLLRPLAINIDRSRNRESNPYGITKQKYKRPVEKIPKVIRIQYLLFHVYIAGISDSARSIYFSVRRVIGRDGKRKRGTTRLKICVVSVVRFLALLIATFPNTDFRTPIGSTIQRARERLGRFSCLSGIGQITVCT